MNRDKWTKQQLCMLDRLYPDNPAAKLVPIIGHSLSAIYRMAKLRGLSKSDIFKASDLSGRIQQGKQSEAMKANQFKPGAKAWNKGKKGWCAPGSEKTQFLKGHLPHNTKHNGAISIRKDKRGVPYYHIRIEKCRWIYYQRYVWEKVNGPVPPNTCVIFIDGNTLNCSIDNLKLITRQENVLRNSINRYGPELRQIIQLTSKAQKLINNHKNTNTNGKK